jgi:hypothetical protein
LVNSQVQSLASYLARLLDLVIMHEGVAERRQQARPRLRF